MLKKDLMIPGSKIQVRSVIKDGVGGTTALLPVFIVDTGPQLTAVINGGDFQVTPGTVLTVVNKPKKRYGSINLARVELPNGNIGDVYWTILRASCDHI